MSINNITQDHIDFIDDNDHYHQQNDDSQQIVIAKVTTIIVLFIASAILGYIPFKLADWYQWNINTKPTKSTKYISILLGFGAGVLLCTTFLHLLPEVSENIKQLQNDNILSEYKFHMAELLMCLGFFTMYFIDELIHIWIHYRQHKQEQQQQQHEIVIESSTSININGSSGTISTTDLLKNDIENEKFCKSLTNTIESITIKPTINQIKNNNNAFNGHSHLSSLPHQKQQQQSHQHINDNDNDIIKSSLRGLLIVLALSIHELFEGLAIGLEHSIGNVWYMFGAVAAHKLVLSFCIGVELITTQTIRWLAIIYILTFAIVTPIGIGIGILISDNETNHTRLLSSILQGFACGTLLYVIFFEILQKNQRTGIVQMFAVIVGFFIMFGLQFIGKKI